MSFHQYLKKEEPVGASSFPVKELQEHLDEIISPGIKNLTFWLSPFPSFGVQKVVEEIAKDNEEDDCCGDYNGDDYDVDDDREYLEKGDTVVLFMGQWDINQHQHVNTHEHYDVLKVNTETGEILIRDNTRSEEWYDATPFVRA